MRILLINLILTLLIFANSGIDGTKIVNGIEYDIVKSEADVMALYNADRGKLLGKTLAFRNLYGEISSCDVSQNELEKYNIGDKVMIFFVVTKEERGKQFYKKIYFNKDDIVFEDGTLSNADRDDTAFGDEAPSRRGKFYKSIDEKKISTKHIASVISKRPIVKLVHEDNSYKYVPNSLNMKLVFMILFTLFIMYLFIKSFNIVGILITLAMLGSFYFIYTTIPNSQKKVFDMSTNEFYSKSPIVEDFYNGYIKFDNIYAFQILKKIECDTYKDNEECYDLYSLNIVLKDYNRLNLVAHGDYETILNDAKTLSEALHKPILNQVDKN